MNKSYPPEKIITILKSARLFSQFDEVQLTQLVAFAKVEQYDAGATIIRENEPNRMIYILLAGILDIYVGDELISKLRRKGDIIGEMSVISKSLTTASVKASTPVVLFTIPAGRIYESGQLELRSLWFKLFSDILAQKLFMTNRKVVGFQEASLALDRKKQELVHKTLILKSVLGSMRDGVVVTDGRGRLLHVNDAFNRMIGTDTLPERLDQWPETLGLHHADGTPYRPDELPMAKAERGILSESEEIFVENRHLKEGIWLSASASLLKTDGGDHLDGCVVVFRDFTKKKAEEAALIKAKENAEATAKAKADFLSVMSHELRTPLNGILGMAGLLNRTGVTAEQAECLDTIRQSGQALLTKIRNILYFNDLESGNIRLRKELIVLSELVDTVRLGLDRAARKKGTRLVPDLCPEAGTPFLGDRKKITQTLENLLDNAVKFTDQGTVTVSATVIEQNDSSVKFRVRIRDTGIGMTEQAMSDLFQPFFQADASLSRAHDGTGLGLAVSKRVVELMGGDLTVESRPGRGSAFAFTLILARPGLFSGQRDADGVTSVKALIHKGYARQNPLRILVAEDNKVNQLLIKKVLAGLGYRPAVAENGRKALEACRGSAFDLVLMDIQMPEMDGLEAAERILGDASIDPHPRIVALTANTTQDIRETCMASGMTDYISKPLDVETLVTVLERLAPA